MCWRLEWLCVGAAVKAETCFNACRKKPLAKTDVPKPVLTPSVPDSIPPRRTDDLFLHGTARAAPSETIDIGAKGVGPLSRPRPPRHAGPIKAMTMAQIREDTAPVPLARMGSPFSRGRE